MVSSTDESVYNEKDEDEESERQQTRAQLLREMEAQSQNHLDLVKNYDLAPEEFKSPEWNFYLSDR